MNEKEKAFKELVAQYCDVNPEDMTPELRFREDLNFSSLDFMTFLGDLEDTFDIEVDEKDVLKIFTLGEAIDYLNRVAA